MIWPIVTVTLRGALGRRRSLLVVLLAALPVLVAGLVRIGGTRQDPADLTAGFLNAMIVATVLPLVALVFGTAVLGAELEDGIAVYLLVKPIERWRIVVAKVAVAAAVTIALILPATLLAGFVIGSGQGGEPVTIAIAIAVIPGSIVYVAGFVALSVVTSRALIVGLLYIFIWEVTLGGLFAATSLLSVRRYILALARDLAGSDGRTITSSLDTTAAIVLSVLVLVVAMAIAIRRLSSWEVRTAE